MSNTEGVELGDHFTTFLSKLTTSGRYATTSEAIRAGLRLLEQEEAKYEALLNALDEGERSGESSRSLRDIVSSARSSRHGG